MIRTVGTSISVCHVPADAVRLLEGSRCLETLDIKASKVGSMYPNQTVIKELNWPLFDINIEEPEIFTDEFKETYIKKLDPNAYNVLQKLAIIFQAGTDETKALCSDSMYMETVADGN